MPQSVGLMVRAERSAEPWPARVVSQVAIYDCAVARDAAREPALIALLGPGAGALLSAIETRPHEAGERCGVHADGFCLQTAAST